ncbi:MAG: hypothetical protein ACJAQT_000398 [Akkermansiaceae bacterium]
MINLWQRRKDKPSAISQRCKITRAGPRFLESPDFLKIGPTLKFPYQMSPVRWSLRILKLNRERFSTRLMSLRNRHLTQLRKRREDINMS